MRDGVQRPPDIQCTDLVALPGPQHPASVPRARQVSLEGHLVPINNWPIQLGPGKRCRKCRTLKPVADFHRNSRLSDGHEHHCKSCRAEKDKIRRASKQLKQPVVTQKACKKCLQTKPASHFQRNAIAPGSLHSYCKECKRKSEMEARLRSKRKAVCTDSDSSHVGQRQRKSVLQTCNTCGTLQADYVQQHPSVGVICQQCIQYGSLNLPDSVRLTSQGTEPKAWIKLCGGCKRSRTTFDFLPDKQSKDNLLSCCRDCLEQANMTPSAGAGLVSHDVHVGTANNMHFGAQSVPDISCSGSQPASAEKVCLDCTETKPSLEFLWDKRHPGTQKQRCQACQNAYKRRQRQAAMPTVHVPVDSKICRRCQEDKAASEFPRNKEALDGIDCYCKSCHQRATADRVAKRGLVQQPTVAHKTCTACQEQKEAGMFHRDVAKADGLRGRCKGCEAETGRARRRAKPPVITPTGTHKTCRRCHIVKAADDFCKKKQRLDGLDCYCKACNCKMAAARSHRKQPVPEALVSSKTCDRCQQEKAAVEFPGPKCRSDALQSCCRSCKAETSATANRAGPETTEPDQDTLLSLPLDLLQFHS